MSPLRKVATIAILGLAALQLTTIGPPSKQLAARWAVWAIHGYQHALRPVVRRYVTCRYVPSCSEYSAEAIRWNGFWPGVVLGARRIASCTKRVPMGTVDLPPRPATVATQRVSSR